MSTYKPIVFPSVNYTPENYCGKSFFALSSTTFCFIYTYICSTHIHIDTPAEPSEYVFQRVGSLDFGRNFLWLADGFRGPMQIGHKSSPVTALFVATQRPTDKRKRSGPHDVTESSSGRRYKTGTFLQVVYYHFGRLWC